MKIQVKKAEGRSITIPLPNWMLFNPPVIHFGLNIAIKYSDQIPDIPPEAIDALCREIRIIQEQYGTWELVRVESARGNSVVITI